MAHYNPPPKNPPWVRNNVQQQPILAQQMTVQSVALSQPALTTTHLAAQNQIGQVQITPAIQSQVQLPIAPTHLLLNHQGLAPAFGQVQINQAQLTNIATSQQQPTAHQTYFTPSISLQQNVGIPQGTIQLQPSSLVIPTTMSTSIAPPGLALPTTLATVHNNTGAYAYNRMTSVPPPPVQQQPQPAVKQRVFTGTVTKLHENFGFIDEDVIFQAGSVKGTIPQVGDKVLAEASYNGAMPFKWNATRVQVIVPSTQQAQNRPTFNSELPVSSSRDRAVRIWSSSDFRDSERSTSKNRDSRARDRRSRSASRSPSRRRSRSPCSPRRRTKTSPRYSVQIPKVSLDCREANVIEMRRRYRNLYLPSELLSSTYSWVDSLQAQRPLPLDRPVAFHIFDKEVDPPVENTAVFEPPDADYAFSAKVMLLSLPSLEEIQRRCCSDDDDFVHPARVIRFLVGHRGKNETMALGGPWSPSLDGTDPISDPQVLIRTAIRTTKALTGIDLTSCTQWYRMAEIRYQRSSTKSTPVESVVLYIPDVWSCVPTAGQWENIVHAYIRPSINQPSNDESDSAAKEEEELAEDLPSVDPHMEPTHHSKLEPSKLKIGELRAELEIRNLNSKGFRSQLIPRLIIAQKAELAEEERKKREETSPSTDEPPSGSASPIAEDDTKRMDFAATPKILVHPSRATRWGKFGCSLVSLSVLLDYRLEDTKEHTFEVSLFSEMFNEMLMRDFGHVVYRSVLNESQRRNKREEEDKKKKERKSDHAHMLLAYCYFDLTHCNYIACKDLEDLFLTLGLQLSRAQVRKLLQKVVTEDMLHYRKLIDRASSAAEEDGEAEAPCPIKEGSADETVSTVEVHGKILDTTVAPNGCFVNVEQLLLRLEQSEESRMQSERQFKSAQCQLTECRTALNKTEETIIDLNQQLKNAQCKYESACTELSRLQDGLNRCLKGVSKIQSITGDLLSPLVDASVKEEASAEADMAVEY